MDSPTTVEAIAKKNNYFPKFYPFPIVRDEPESTFRCVIGHIKDQCVEVSNQEDIYLLYTKGFYGVGSLTRGTPHAVEERIKKEFGEKKKKKSSSVKDKSSSQNQSEDAEVEVVESEGDEDEIIPKKEKEDEIEVVLSDSNSSDSEESGDPKSGENECLQLTFEEAYFLSYGFGCLVVKDKDQPLDLMRLWHRFCELHPAQNFPVMYTAYHHFRSKGWVVRSGLLYGTDFVLYKDGPPYYHSSYAVIVKPVKEENFRDVKGPGGGQNLTWASLSGVYRVCSHVSKTLMILYVIKPTTMSDNKISTPYCVSQYLLEEVLVKRWVPSKNRSEDTNSQNENLSTLIS